MRVGAFEAGAYRDDRFTDDDDREQAEAFTELGGVDRGLPNDASP